MNNEVSSTEETPRTLAAVDLGSNSFHLIIAQYSNGKLSVIDKLREMVRLRAGLDEEKRLTSEAQQTALDCLSRFAQRLQHIPTENIRIVGTNTLRTARNSREFLRQAHKILGHPIQIISGIEEARLIYTGVAHSLAETGQKRMVIDIGGGSTEIIIGEQFTPSILESIPVGCVSMTLDYFANGKITAKKFRKAHMATRLELENVAHEYLQSGWEQTIGASGTIRSIAKILHANNWSSGNITREGMEQLKHQVLAVEHIDQLQLDGLSEDRRPVILGGFVVLYTLFDALNIKEMDVSDGAVREGLIYDLIN